MQRAGKRALCMSKEFTFKELVGDGRTVHLHEGATPTFAAIVNGACDQFLSSSRFSQYQNVGRRRGNQINLFENIPKRCASSDKTAKVFLYLIAQIVVFQFEFLAKMLNLLKSSGVRDRHGSLISEQTKPLKLLR